ncbi:hypothetical protein DB346_22475 [Verrucomicrobia bacterium LW23]|nr:hypothetical protein DB346_22475 [Verrucomicrobia bacterium LW23]
MSAATVQQDSRVRTVCPYCGVGCGMYLQVKDGKVIKAQGDKEHPSNHGKLCTKGATSAQTLDTGDRLSVAQLREGKTGPLRAVEMEAALDHVAARLRGTMDEHGPDAVAFYVSGQLSLECQYVVNKLSKGFIATNNIESNSRLCMSSAASGYKLSLGADGPPGSYQDFESTNLFFVIGSNMAECHPILYLRMQAARKKTGARLIVVDPRRTATAEKADLYLPIEPGSDLALLNGLLHLLLEAGHVDPAFIAAHTDGWEQMPAFLAHYTPVYVSELTGLAEKDIRTAAQWMGEAKEFMSLWTMGLNQSTHGTWQTNAICNLHLATGKICRPGSGPFSLTGQPNAMGGREVGYLSHGLPGQRTVARPADRAFIENFWGLPTGTIRPTPGPDAVNMFRRMEAGEIKALWVIGSNPVATMPRRSGVANALEKAELVVVQDVYFPTETARYADVLLPGAVWAEAEGTMVNSERMVTLMQKATNPPGDSLPDWEIVCRVAAKMGFADAFAFPTAAAVFDEIRSTANPATGYDLRGMSHARLRTSGPIQWPCGPGEEKGRGIRYVDAEGALRFPTETGRGAFFARPCMPPAEMPDEAFPMILTTGRVVNQWHTMTKTGKVQQLNKLDPGSYVEIHPEDAAQLAIRNGQKVEVRSRRGLGIYPARVTTDIRPGVCFVPFHWNDVYGENLAINAATNDATDPISMQPELKFCAVALTAVPGGADDGAEAGEEIGAGMDMLEAQSFTPEQKSYLQQFLTGELRRGLRPPDLVPAWSEDAPFSAPQRAWLDGFLAGAAAASLAPVTAGATRKAAPAPTAAALVG